MVVFDGHEFLTNEEKRLAEDRKREKYWKKWGPYVAERQWATGELTLLSVTTRAAANCHCQCARTTAPTVMHGAVSTSRPGYTRHCQTNSCTDFSHEHSRSRAYRWGEDGISGVCDTHGHQNIAFAFWNGKE